MVNVCLNSTLSTTPHTAPLVVGLNEEGELADQSNPELRNASGLQHQDAEERPIDSHVKRILGVEVG